MSYKNSFEKNIRKRREEKSDDDGWFDDLIKRYEEIWEMDMDDALKTEMMQTITREFGASSVDVTLVVMLKDAKMRSFMLSALFKKCEDGEEEEDKIEENAQKRVKVSSMDKMRRTLENTSWKPTTSPVPSSVSKDFVGRILTVDDKTLQTNKNSVPKKKNGISEKHEIPFPGKFNVTVKKGLSGQEFPVPASVDMAVRDFKKNVMYEGGIKNGDFTFMYKGERFGISSDDDKKLSDYNIKSSRAKLTMVVVD